MKDLFRALEAYTDKHCKRMEELIDESYLLEYTLREMDDIAGTAPTANGIHSNNNDGDILMVWTHAWWSCKQLSIQTASSKLNDTNMNIETAFQEV